MIAALVPPASQAVVNQEAIQKGRTIAFSIEDVRKVQVALRDRGYDPGAINGMMTSETRAAIRQFQTANNLPATGTIDERTQSQLGVSFKRPLEVMRAKPTPALPESREKIQTPTTPHGNMTATDVSKAEKDPTKIDGNLKDASEKISKAAAVLHALTNAGDKRIPAEMLQRAEAVAVIPEMVKGALAIGGRYGKGVVSARQNGSSWSAPAFIQIGGGSFGAQIGVTSTDLVLIFTDADALNTLEGGAELKLGADAAIVAGPVGRSAEAGVDIGLDSAIFAYSRSQGLFAGIALDGAVLDVDEEINRSVYGTSVNARQILAGRVAVNDTVRPFINAIQTVIPRQKISKTR
jgi:lipid-binding SYLF domain-containing protein